MADVVTSGARHERPRRRWPAVALLVLVVVGLALGWADHAERRHEYDELGRLWAAGLATSSYADRRVASIVEYASPHLQTAPAGVRAGLRALVEDAAAGEVADLRAARDAVASAPVLAWHRTLAAARSACVGYLEARVRFLEAVAKDAFELGRRPPGLDAELTEAGAALAAAAP